MEPTLPFLDPRILTAASTTRSDDVPVILLFADTDGLTSFHTRNTRNTPNLHIQHQGSQMPYTAGQLRKADVEDLTRDTRIRAIWYDAMCSTCLDHSGAHTGLHRAWADFGLSGQNSLIGIADTGLDDTHPDFAGRVEGSQDFTGLVASSSKDLDGHGTHVASIACGSGAASQGRFAGAAPGAHVLAARVMGKGGTGRMSQVMAGLEWLSVNGAHIINLSVGTSATSLGDDPLSQMCALLVSKGTIVVVAAGNTGPQPRTIGSPGSSAHVITVGAVDQADRVVAYSSRGPTARGLLKPDLVAPGHEIVAARATGTSLGEVVDAYYTRMSGTSMATPLIAGLCALMRELQPDLTPVEVKDILQLHCLALNQPAVVQGTGRVDAWTVLQSLAPAPAPQPTEPAEDNVDDVPETPDAAQPTPVPASGCLGHRVSRFLQRIRPLPT